jgi:hypothetical protein
MADESLFDQAAKTPDSTPDQDAAVENFLNEYVGEGKKYKTVEDLAKAKHHADKHIDELRSDLTSMKDFISAQFENLGNRDKAIIPDPNEEDKDRKPDPVAPPKGDEEDLNARILKLLEEKDETSRLKKNADFAQEVMIEQFGSQEAAVEAVRVKAQELGVSPQFLADTAFRSPQALFNIMGIAPGARSKSTPNASSDVNPRILDKVSPGAKPGTMAYYDQLRRSDPGKYWSVPVQQQLMKDALEKGQDFFKR